MEKRPYWQDPSPMSGETEILETRPGDGCTWLRLSGSLFYPESGGQRPDRGSVGGMAVLDVREENGVLWHGVELAGEAPRGPLPQRVDAGLRRDHSEQHSGQHLLSAACVELLGAATLSFHMGEHGSTVELESELLGGEEIARIEARCWELIAENRPIRIHYPDAAAAARMPLRKEPSVSDGLRVVEITGYDWSPCGGTHLAATGELAAIFLGRQERIRGRVRLEFVAGRRALAAGAGALREMQSLGEQLTCGVPEIGERIAAMQDQVARLRKREKSARRDRLAHEAAALAAEGAWVDAGPLGALLSLDLGEREGDEVAELASQLCAKGEPPRCLLLAWREGDGTGLLFQRGRGEGPHLGELLRELLDAAGGRGGGGPDRARGGLAGGAGEILALARGRLTGG